MTAVAECAAVEVRADDVGLGDRVLFTMPSGELEWHPVERVLSSDSGRYVYLVGPKTSSARQGDQFVCRDLRSRETVLVRA